MRRLTSSQEMPEAGLFMRLAFRRASSSFCQSWTGTSSGFDARSSQRSSTSWSFSAGLKSKMEPALMFLAVLSAILSAPVFALTAHTVWRGWLPSRRFRTSLLLFRANYLHRYLVALDRRFGHFGQ